MPCCCWNRSSSREERTRARPFPKNAAERAACASRSRAKFAARFASIADQCREKLIELYGEEQGKKVRYAEAFEICEFGRQPTADEHSPVVSLPAADEASQMSLGANNR